MVATYEAGDNGDVGESDVLSAEEELARVQGEEGVQLRKRVNRGRQLRLDELGGKVVEASDGSVDEDSRLSKDM